MPPMPNALPSDPSSGALEVVWKLQTAVLGLQKNGHRTPRHKWKHAICQMVRSEFSSPGVCRSFRAASLAKEEALAKERAWQRRRLERQGGCCSRRQGLNGTKREQTGLAKGNILQATVSCL